MGSTTIHQVDAFTSVPFRGNPAAVCMLPAFADDIWLQNVASELNLSETAFVVPDGEAFHLRWFTPVVEVDLCGHATLAASHVLFETGQIPLDAEAVFRTRSGVLRCRRDGEWLTMDFPAEPAIEVVPPASLIDALGSNAKYVGKNRMDYLVELSDAESVTELSPNMNALAHLGARGVIVTARSGSDGHDFVSRFFAPALGVPEDPVTGSAHCCLGPYWAEMLGKKDVVGYQASRRGGTVRVSVIGDRVQLTGQAVTVMRIELLT